jgi:hypothetical protein
MTHLIKIFNTTQGRKGSYLVETLEEMCALENFLCEDKFVQVIKR